jgi:hypothetical protein
LGQLALSISHSGLEITKRLVGIPERLNRTPRGEENVKSSMLVLLVLLLAAGPAVSQTSDDTLIVPGVRIGKWTLKMTIDDLLRMNGPVNPVLFNAGSEQTLDARQDVWVYGWLLQALGAVTIDRRTIEVLVAGDGGRVVPFKTDRGITLLQSRRRSILAVYGKPTAALKASYGQSELIYEKIGLGFRVYDDGGQIQAIYVFRPGRAKSFWKF